MSDAAAVRRQLKIKTAAVQRLSKETKVYNEETSELETKLNKLKEKGNDAEEWDIKNATKMVEESKKMIVDATTRLGKAAEDLQALITSAKEEFGLPIDDEELINAEKAVQQATA
ncbi:tubulin binding cofactor A [Gymnopilus junonius]|uniref:Tubulin-specific chaperone A n=1 Tax=Gymnopilus junonius TaxID=109634 RepID=A0A9P5NXG5_GYMJU|nr:tubulin binding cofactor A [Gymnopilus junonius]